MPNTQVVQQPFLYVNNLQITVASDTTLSVAAGQARDSTNVTDITLSAATTLNAAVNGINGLDTGTFAASTWYYVYLIGDSTLTNDPGVILSLSASTPTLPSGYDVYRLIGMELTDSSVHFLANRIVGNGNEREVFWESAILVLNDEGNTSYTAVTLTAGVPPIDNTPVHLYGSFVPQAAGNVWQVRPSGSTSTLNQGGSGVVISVEQGFPNFTVLSRLVSSVAKIDYITSHASDDLSLFVSGFKFYL
jgi:hypothetical protein